MLDWEVKHFQDNIFTSHTDHHNQ